MSIKLEKKEHFLYGLILFVKLVRRNTLFFDKYVNNVFFLLQDSKEDDGDDSKDDDDDDKVYFERLCKFSIGWGYNRALSTYKCSLI